MFQQKRGNVKSSSACSYGNIWFIASMEVRAAGGKKMTADGRLLKFPDFQLVVGGMVDLQALHAKACQTGNKLLCFFVSKTIQEGVSQSCEAMSGCQRSYDLFRGKELLRRTERSSVMKVFFKNLFHTGTVSFAEKRLCYVSSGDNGFGVFSRQLFWGYMNPCVLQTVKYFFIAAVSGLLEAFQSGNKAWVRAIYKKAQNVYFHPFKGTRYLDSGYDLHTPF